MGIKTLSIVALAASTLGLCSAAYADQGFYVGGQAGYGNPSYDSSGSTSSDKGGVAGRAYAGYQFNQYFGVETGFTQFSNNTYKYNYLPLFNAKITAKTQQWDILGKVGTPFGCSGFRGDIKAGAAYVLSDLDFSGSALGYGINGSHSSNTWNPAAGASLSYNFNKNFAVDVSYLHTFGSSSKIRNHFNNSNYSPDTNLATVGISYLFA